MAIKLTIDLYGRRRADLLRQLDLREKTFASTALAVATGQGSDEEQSRAREAVQETQDNLRALDAAWQAHGVKQRASEIVAEQEAWREAEETMSGLARECSAAGARAGRALNEFIAAYAVIVNAQAKMREVMSPWQRKAPLREPDGSLRLTLIELRAEPRALGRKISAAIRDLGIPVFQLNKAESNGGSRIDFVPELDDLAREHLRAFESFIPATVREDG